jgi:hypothetical protein
MRGAAKITHGFLARGSVHRSKKGKGEGAERMTDCCEIRVCRRSNPTLTFARCRKRKRSTDDRDCSTETARPRLLDRDCSTETARFTLDQLIGFSHGEPPALTFVVSQSPSCCHWIPPGLLKSNFEFRDFEFQMQESSNFEFS